MVRRSKKPDKAGMPALKKNIWLYAAIAVLVVFAAELYHDYSVNKGVLKRADAFLSSVFSSQGVQYSLEKASVERVYRLDINAGGQKGEVYVTTDGKYILQKVAEIPETVQEDAGIPKTDVPTVELFVMSYCPFGLQMEKAMLPVIDLLGDSINFSVHYVIYDRGQECMEVNGTRYCSLHGNYELEEDIRQYCVGKIYGQDVLHKYLRDFAFNCSYENQTCWESVAANLSLDRSAIESCVQEESQTGEFLSSEVSLNQKYGVTGSPTLVINGKVVRASRSPEAVKSLICSAFTNPPEECSQTLSAEQTSPGFGSKTGSDAAAAASCAG